MQRKMASHKRGHRHFGKASAAVAAKTSTKRLRECVSVTDMEIKIKVLGTLQFRLVAHMSRVPLMIEAMGGNEQ